MKKNTDYRFLARMTAVIMIIATLAMMFLFSAEEGGASSERSEWVAGILARAVVPGFSEMSSVRQAALIQRMQMPVRKGAHMAEYAFLGCWLCVLLRTLGIKGLRGAGLALILSVAFAGADEFHQRFTAGRGAALRDVGIDCLGAIIGILIATWLLSFLSRMLAGR